jgi:DNA polymerase III epsilon subunit family exonuclease
MGRSEEHPWWWYPLAIIDTETTGVRPGDRIVQIGIVSVNRGEVTDQWESLINPGIPIPEVVTKIHGITDDIVSDAPRFDDIRSEIGNRLVSRIPVAYNQSFDRRFIQREWGPDVPDDCPALDPDRGPWVDPYLWLRRRYGWKKPKGYYKLESVAKRHGIEFDGYAHSALADALATFDIMPVALDGCPETIEKFMAVQTRTDTSMSSRRRSR